MKWRLRPQHANSGNAAVAPLSSISRPALTLDRQAPAILIAVLMLMLVELLPDYQLHSVTGWVIAGILALSLDFVWGFGGIPSLAQAALYGLVAYFFGFLATNLQSSVPTVLLLPAGALCGGLVAIVLGYFLFYSRMSEVEVAVMTYAAALGLLAVSNKVQMTIGQVVMSVDHRIGNVPPLRFGLGSNAVTLGDQGSYLLVVFLAILLYLGLQAIIRAPLGMVVFGLRANELRTILLGFDARFNRLVVFVIGGAVAGLAGALFSSWNGSIGPESFTPAATAVVVVSVLLGGRGTLLGAFVGAFVVQAALSVAGGQLGGHISLLLGLALVGVVVFMPGGLVSLWENARRRVVAAAPPFQGEQARPGPTPVSEAASQGEVSLAADNVNKRFGGIQALKDVTISPQGPQILGLLGPAGSGKTTLLAILAGCGQQDQGRILYQRKDITAWRAHARSRAGIALSPQQRGLFDQLTVGENLWLAAYAGSRKASVAAAKREELLESLRFRNQADAPAASLAAPEQRRLKIGMLLALRPTVALLDEPAMGMPAEDAEEIAQLIKYLAASCAVIVASRDFLLLRKLDAQVTVLDRGRVLETGPIAEIEQSDDVLDLYVGEGRPAEALA